MKDDTGRPGSGDKVPPLGTRARNSTMLMGSEKVGSFLTSAERAASVRSALIDSPPQAQERDGDDLDGFEGQDTGAPVLPNDDFQSFDEIFGGMPEEHTTKLTQEPSDPFGLVDSPGKDASSTLIGDLGADDEFHSALDVFEPPLESPASVSAPRIVRTSSGSDNPSAQVAPQDLFDPFAAIDHDGSDGPQTVEEPIGVVGQHVDAASGGLPVYERAQEAPPVPLPPPKIVRPGDIGMPNERVIVPTPQSGFITAGSPEAGRPKAVLHPQKTSAHQVAKEGELMSELRDHIFWKNESPLVGFLVTYDHDPKGAYVELRQGRLMVSNQREESGSCLVVVGESVSPMHAIMRVASGGGVQVLDQLSESGTRVKHFGQVEEVFLSGEKCTLSHGDIVFFGDRKFHVLLVVAEMDEA